MPKKKTNAANMFQRIVDNHVPTVDDKEHVPYNGTHKDELEHEEMVTATLEQPKAEGNVSQFKQYTKRGKKPAELAHRIAIFLAKLSQAQTVDAVKYVCEEEKGWFFEKYPTPGTRNRYMTSYRHAIQDCFGAIGIPQGLATERETSKGLVIQHVAMNYMIGLPEDYASAQSQTKTKTAEQRDNLKAFDINSAIEAAQEALKSDDWRELAAGLLLCVQCRPSDLLAVGKFKAASGYQVEFTSKAKKRGKSVTGNVWTIVDSFTFIDAFNRLRGVPDIVELQGKTLTEIDSGRNSTLNRAINRVFKACIPAPYGEIELSAKNLRAAGVNINYHLHGRDDQSIGRFAELQLLHDSSGTAANYEDYYCTQDGKRLGEVGILDDKPLEQKPLSETKSNIVAPKAVLDVFRDTKEWGAGTNADRMVRIIAAGREAKRSKERANKLEKELSAAQAKIKELENTQSMTTTKPKQQGSTTDIQDISNAELIGSKKRGAAEEKLRRTIEAIQAYNKERAFEEQIAINKGSLRKITKVKAQTVNEWADEHNEQIEAYTDVQGHGYRQNVGKDLSVIKWDEGAYGSYEWPEGYF